MLKLPFNSPNHTEINKKEEANLLNFLFFVSGYQDSNLGPPAPKAGALTGLRYTPFCNPFIVDCGAKVSIYFYPPNISCSFLIDYFRICLITRFKGKEVKQQKEGQADMNILLANML